MNRLLRLVACLALLLYAFWGVQAHAASTSVKVRIGYMDTPGSGLVLLASAWNSFNDEGLRTEVVKVASPESALALLNNGTLDAVAMDALFALRTISDNDRIAIFSGSGHLSPGPLDELVTEPVDSAQPGRVVVVALRERLAHEQSLFNPLVHALIKAYSRYFQKPETALAAIRPRLGLAAAGEAHPVFDPNPGYDNLARLWKEQKLQRQGQPRDYLSNHVNEEYFCDALYLLLEQTPKDPGLNQLLKRAVCPPDCCPLRKTAPAQEK